MTDNVKCPFCKLVDLKYKRKIKSVINKKVYTHRYCRNCELEFFTPLEFEDIYNVDMLDNYKSRHKWDIKIKPWNEEVVKAIKRLWLNVQRKKILDIWAGNCINFLVLKKYFNISPDNYFAIELDKNSVRVCKSLSVKNVLDIFFNKDVVKKIKFKFDLIIATEVLEHQIDPKEFIETCFGILNNGGYIIFTLPNREMSFHKFKEVPGDIPPHHFLRFNKDFFIKNFKFNLVDVYTYTFNNKNFIDTAKSLSKVIFKNTFMWILFLPLVFFIRILDYLKPEGLIVILKK